MLLFYVFFHLFTFSGDYSKMDGIKAGGGDSGMKAVYEIMHGERNVARVDTQGRCKVYDARFMPFNLYLEETEGSDMDADIDTLVNNVTNFYYWCSMRILTLDRRYAKEILNSIGAAQAVTDRDRAQIALTYHCLSLTDIFWVKKEGEEISFREINLYDNHLDNAFVDVSLRGKQITVQNDSLIPDLMTNGCFPKAWVRTENGFRLLKDGDSEYVENELLASRVCQCFRCRQVVYEEDEYEGEKVSSSQIMTSKRYSIVSREAFEIYAVNHEIDALEYILDLDRYSYHMMNILDYLVGNTDRHWGNWGFLVDNETNRPVSLHPLMDFNQAFRSYDTVEGANCQTMLPERMTQMEAAVYAVKQIGLNQAAEIRKEWFEGREREYGMLMRRLEVLKV